MAKVTAPEPLSAAHATEKFECGESVLNEWLKRRALKNEDCGASRTFVVCKGNQVIGYYALATGSVTHGDAPGKFRRNMPEPIPVMVLGRLAVDRQHPSSGIDRGLLKDAVLRSLVVSRHAGIKALLVHAISDEACNYYLGCGFTQSPLDPMVLMITLKDAQQHFRGL
ncbi:MAG: GNAT family N-acetyltransferase [Pseudomonadota bacterium]